MTRIAIRADASSTLGSGHIMRCLTLADALRARGALTRFLCRDTPGHLAALIAERGHAVDLLPDDPAQDASATQALLSGGVETLIVDHYGLDKAWESALRPCAARLMVIDDLANRPHDADLLLDQNAFPDASRRYADLLPPTAQQLLGPRYALLAPAFAARRQPADRRPPVTRVLVFLGGADPHNHTRRALRALDTFPHLAVDVVAGHAHPALGSLQAWCAARPHAVLHSTSSRFAEQLAAVDLVIGAGGTTCWERCCLGLPSLVLGIADNQLAVADALAQLGAHLYLGAAETVSDATIAAALATLIAAPALRQSLAERAQALVDGRGAERVADSLLAPRLLALRPARLDDGERLYAWRNQAQTRQFFFDPAPIPLATHQAWFRQAIADPARVLLIGSDGDAPVGLVRYDLQGEDADISVYLDPQSHGRGLGSALLRAGTGWMQRHRPEIRKLHAHIHPENQASLAAFSAAGFTEHSRHLALALRT